MLAKVEVPYRVIDIAAGDLGGPAARKFDCEAWVPTQGRYRELTSTSQLHDVPGAPARRARARPGGEGRPGTSRRSTARWRTTRWIVAILENHQQADGSVVVPKALQPFLGLDVLDPRLAERGRSAERLVALDLDGTTLRPRRRAVRRRCARRCATWPTRACTWSSRPGARSWRRCRSSSQLGLQPRLRRLLQRRRHDRAGRRREPTRLPAAGGGHLRPGAGADPAARRLAGRGRARSRSSASGFKLQRPVPRGRAAGRAARRDRGRS